MLMSILRLISDSLVGKALDTSVQVAGLSPTNCFLGPFLLFKSIFLLKVV